MWQVGGPKSVSPSPLGFDFWIGLENLIYVIFINHNHHLVSEAGQLSPRHCWLHGAPHGGVIPGQRNSVILPPVSDRENIPELILLLTLVHCRPGAASQPLPWPWGQSRWTWCLPWWCHSMNAAVCGDCCYPTNLNSGLWITTEAGLCSPSDPGRQSACRVCLKPRLWSRQVGGGVGLPNLLVRNDEARTNTSYHNEM